MLALVAAHLVLAALLPLLSARSHRAAFLTAAVLPAAALIWAFGHLPRHWAAGSPEPPSGCRSWAWR
ncbi:MAG TPA: hypothetical protein VE645_09625 [Pseudonocardiaceae bacterium]|nr:hypothetical protein [Pseudonocardiaceae bacterium]